MRHLSQAELGGIALLAGSCHSDLNALHHPRVIPHDRLVRRRELLDQISVRRDEGCRGESALGE